ncbi:hypothetical protein [Pseudomonas brenneri]|uniref:hypothetical protein n=1 Tax=Pseudomonas brenneri TaxID=129817 RepID=UPI003B9EC84D
MQITGQECSRLVNNGANGWSSCAMVLSSRMPGKRALNGASRAYVGFWFHCSPNPSTGYELEIGSGSFSGSELTVQLKIRIPGGVSKERTMLELECKHRGFDPDTTLKSSSYGEFNLVGYHPRRPKYPWTVQIVGGQLYKFTDEAITDAFNRLKN